MRGLGTRTPGPAQHSRRSHFRSGRGYRRTQELGVGIHTDSVKPNRTPLPLPRQHRPTRTSSASLGDRGEAVVRMQKLPRLRRKGCVRRACLRRAHARLSGLSHPSSTQTAPPYPLNRSCPPTPQPHRGLSFLRLPAVSVRLAYLVPTLPCPPGLAVLVVTRAQDCISQSPEVKRRQHTICVVKLIGAQDVEGETELAKGRVRKGAGF